MLIGRIVRFLRTSLEKIFVVVTKTRFNYYAKRYEKEVKKAKYAQGELFYLTKKINQFIESRLSVNSKKNMWVRKVIFPYLI